MDSITEGYIFGLGNPLLDLISVVDENFIKKWDLNTNDAIVAGEKHIGLDQDMIKNYSVQYNAGGSVQNTFKIIQWLFDFKPKVCTFIGAIGKDSYGEIMKKKAIEESLDCIYFEDENDRTGYCCVMLTSEGKNRSLCAYLGAANNLKLEHVLQNWSSVEKAKLYYTSGFHLNVCFQAIFKIAQYSDGHENKCFFFNLSAPFVPKFHNKELLELLPYVDTVFGNGEEALTFAEVNEWIGQNLSQIVLKIANFTKNNSKKSRTVIITQGHGPVLVASSGDKTVKEFKVKEMDPSQLVDTNGAGDAFVAGYISQYILGKTLKERIEVGIYAAQEIIQQNGCQYPPNPATLV